MSSPSETNAARSLAPPTQLFPLIRHLSYRLTPLFVRLPVTPNQITAASLVTGLAGAYCFALGTRHWALTGALLLVAGHILDNCDGEIARFKSMSSAFGAFFDDVVDWLVDAAFFAALGIGTASAAGQDIWLWLGWAAAAGATIDYVIDLILEARSKKDPAARSREEQASEPKKPEKPLDWIIYIFHKVSRADFCLIVLVLTAFNVTWVLLPLGALGAQAYWITDLFSRARGYHT